MVGSLPRGRGHPLAGPLAGENPDHRRERDRDGGGSDQRPCILFVIQAMLGRGICKRGTANRPDAARPVF